MRLMQPHLEAVDGTVGVGDTVYEGRRTEPPAPDKPHSGSTWPRTGGVAILLRRTLPHNSNGADSMPTLEAQSRGKPTR